MTFTPFIVPVHPGQKRPALTNWSVITAPVLPRQGQGTGYLTGSRSGCVVLDFDVKGGVNGPASLLGVLDGTPSDIPPHVALSQLMSGGHLPITRYATTPSGGWHFYFQHPGHDVRNSAGTIAPGVDFRGDGGFIVAPPTPGYAWGWEGDLAPMPPWFLEHARKHPHKEGAPAIARRGLPDTLQECCAMLSALPKGERNYTLARVAYKAGLRCWEGSTDALRNAIAAWDPNAMSTHLGTIDRQIREGAAGGIMINTELDRMVDEASDKLAFDGDLFSRKFELTMVFRTPGVGTTPNAGAPVLRPISRATLKERLSTHAEFRRWVAPKADGSAPGKAIPAMPPEDVIAALFDRGTWRNPEVQGVLESPAMRADGTIITAEGYDPPTGLYHVPTISVDVPEAPTHQQARDAFNRMAGLWRQFPWMTPDHVCVPIAAVLSFLARPAIDHVPGFVFDASTKGSGKTLLARSVGRLALGRDISAATLPEGRERGEEIEKILGSMAIAGATVAFFDNVTDGATFGNGSIDRVLTNERTSFRILGRTQQAELPWTAIMMVTGNNIQIAKDTTRRVLICRLEPSTETPQHRTGFEHPQLLEYIGQHRKELVTDALTVLRGWVAAGGLKGAPAPSIGTFERWSRLVAGAISWASGTNILKFFAETTNEDPERAAMLSVVRLMPEVWPEGAMARQVAELWDMSSTTKNQELREAFETLAGAPSPSPIKLGFVLRRVKGRIIAGRKLMAKPNLEGISVWKVGTP